MNNDFLPLTPFDQINMYRNNKLVLVRRPANVTWFRSAGFNLPMRTYNKGTR